MSALATSRMIWGIVLVVAPGVAVRLLGGERATPTWRLVGRLLGVRHLAQAMLENNHEHRPAWVDPAVDAVHGLTSLSLALLKPRYRRLGAVDAFVAAGFAAWGTTYGIGVPDGVHRPSPVLIGVAG